MERIRIFTGTIFMLEAVILFCAYNMGTPKQAAMLGLVGCAAIIGIVMIISGILAKKNTGGIMLIILGIAFGMIFFACASLSQIAMQDHQARIHATDPAMQVENQISSS